MRRISFPAGVKLSNVFGAAARRRQYLLRVFSALVLLLFASVAHAQSTAQNTISTVAGSAPANNVSPTGAALAGPQAVVRDASGNLFVVNDNGVIYEVPAGTPAPTMVIYGGNNTAGFSPNGTLATSALTHDPTGAAVDTHGNLFFSDQNNCVVREITTAGVINTVAGTPGVCNYSGDNGPATSAQLSFPQGVAIDSSGTLLYITDIGNSIIRLVNLTTGIITTYAGEPQNAGFPTNGALATSTQLAGPVAVAVDTGGNLFIADQNDNVVCRVDAKSKILTIVAGTGAFGFSGDGGPATSATMRAPDGVAVDGAGNIYISDSESAVIREVFSSTSPHAGEITTIVGTGTFGFNGDGAATSIELTNPAGLFVDPTTGNLWIADFWANRIRLYTASTTTVTTVVGSGLVGDGGQATSASFYFPRAPALDSQGNLYIVDAENNRIRKVDTAGVISTVVGTGIPCAQPSFLCGDGGLAVNALLFMPRTVTIEANGDLLVSDDGDNRIREVSGGNINTVVGSGNQCGSGQGQVPLPCGDGGPALQASVNDARGAVRDAAGNLFFVDAQDNRVREVDTTGTITTIAGGGTNDTAPTGCNAGSYTGDNGPAVNATLDCPLGLDIDSAGNLYVADTDNDVIRKIDTGSPRIITTIAGTGRSPGLTGNGGLATSATLNSPDRVSVNGAGNFFISDSGNNVIRRVDGTSKIITAFAGNGTFAFAGDNGPALSASFATPVGVVVTPEGNMYVGDVLNNRIRKVLLNPNVALSSNAAQFGNQPISVGATPLPVTVTNSGDKPLTISSIALTGASVFSLATSTNPCPVSPATLAIGAQCVIEVGFTPTQFVTSTGTITITDNGPTANSAQTINVTGTGAAELTVTESGSGTGTVTSAPAGISCPTTCTATFTGNSQVTLTATPGTNSTFAGFTNCPSEGLACKLTMSGAEAVTATFTATSTGGGGLTISPTTLPNGAIGAAYGQTLQVSGGTPPFNFTISAGTLPAGLSLGATSGSIAGVPTGPAGASTFTVTVTDSSTPPLAGSAAFNVTISAADASNDAELNGSYAFLFQGFNDSDGTMVVVAASFLADGKGTITSGFEDADGSTGAQPTQTFTGTYTLGADNRGTMVLKTSSGGAVVLAFAVGDIQSGVATKARFIRFDDVSGTKGQTGSGVILKQDPSAFSLTDVKGAYAFGESGTDLTNGDLESGVGFVNADGNGNFTPAGVIDLDDGGALVQSAAISGTYALTNETVSNGRLSGSVTIAGIKGTTSDVLYIVSPSTVLFISINTTVNSIFSGTAQLQVPPTGGFGLSSLKGNGVVALQGKRSDGTAVVGIGTAALDGAGNFTLSFDQNKEGTSTTGTAGGTYTVAGNGRAVLTVTTGSFSSPTAIIYLDAANQGFFAGTDTAASVGFIEPGGSGFSNASLSGNYFLGTFDPAESQVGDTSGVASFDGVGTLQSTLDGSNSGGVLGGDSTSSSPYAVASNGRLTFNGQSGGQMVGYVASGCEAEVITINGTNPGIASFECQVTPTTGPTLTVTEAGTGTGTVTSSPTGIICPPTTTCSASFTSGTNVTLTATANSGSTFAAFSSNCIAPSTQTNPPTCVVTMSAAETVTVTFNAVNSSTLTVTEAGTGTGTVASTPSGILCPSTCSASFALNSQVTLTATANSGSTFASFSTNCVAPSPQTNPPTCVVTIGATIAAQTVTATFNTANSATLTVNVNGPGTVSSNPSGILCPSQCSAPFASGSQVTLTATANSGPTSASFSNCTPANPQTNPPTCVVTMSAAETVTVTFNAVNSSTLTVTEAGTGTGTVISAPTGILCPSTCSASFTSGSQVVLTATANSGSTFAGFSGNCVPPSSPTNPPTCTVTMSAAEAVTATFNSGNSPVTIGLAPGSPSTVNTTPGNSAIFGLTLTSLPGVTGKVQLGCTVNSPNAADITCDLVPSSIVLTGKPINVAIVVETFCKGAVPGFGPSLPGGLVAGLAMLLASMSLCGAMWTFKRRPRWALSFAVLMLIAVGMSACSSLPKSPGGLATPPGSYALVVTATAPNGAVSSVPLTLVVGP